MVVLWVHAATPKSSGRVGSGSMGPHRVLVAASRAELEVASCGSRASTGLHTTLADVSAHARACTHCVRCVRCTSTGHAGLAWSEQAPCVV